MTADRPGWSADILRLFARGSGAGDLPPGPGRVGKACSGAVSSGIAVCIALRVDRGRVTALAWRSHGCPATQAACAWLAEHAPGSTPSALGDLARATRLAEVLGAPPGRLGALLVVENALKLALSNIEQHDE